MSSISWINSKWLRILRWALWIPAIAGCLVGGFSTNPALRHLGWSVFLVWNCLNVLFLELYYRNKRSEAGRANSGSATSVEEPTGGNK